MKNPRIQDFDPEAAERHLNTPLDGMPVIEATKKPAVKSTRRFVRRTFDYFEDQIEFLTRVSLEGRLAGRDVTMASMLREALDRYISEKTTKK